MGGEDIDAALFAHYVLGEVLLKYNVELNQDYNSDARTAFLTAVRQCKESLGDKNEVCEKRRRSGEVGDWIRVTVNA